YADRYLARSPLANPAPARISIAADGGQAPVFRISPVEPWRIVRTRLRASGLSKGLVEGGGRPAGYFTGATGITIYRGDAWPSELSGIAIIGDVGSNIVHRKKLVPNGVVWSAERMDPGRELVASRDIWFRPVQYANAPDGCLHILDMYREVIEHPASLPPEIKKHLDLTSGRDRGRLYRLAPTNYSYRPSPQLSKASTAQLTALLEHPNAWHRETATRLLYERQDQSAVPLLRTLLRASRPTSPFARFHTIAALEGLSALTAEDVLIVLGDPSPEVRERAILAAEAFRDAPAIQQALFTMTSEAAPRTLMQLAFTLGELPESPARLEALTQILTQAGADRWIRTAALSSLGNSAPQALVALARNAAQHGAAAALPELADLAARRTQSADQLNTFREALAAAAKLPALQVRLLQAAATANPAIATKPEFQELT
ncbi:MAG: HEAT repeat domain-containing protein, partial [Planctomycetaceae bacterium]